MQFPSVPKRSLWSGFVAFVAVTEALNSCFNTDDYTVTRGQPYVLTWPADPGYYDIALVTDQDQFVGYIASEFNRTGSECNLTSRRKCNRFLPYLDAASEHHRWALQLRPTSTRPCQCMSFYELHGSGQSILSRL